MPPKGTKKRASPKGKATAAAEKPKRRSASIERILEANVGLGAWGNVAAASNERVSNSVMMKRMANAAAEANVRRASRNAKQRARIIAIQHAAEESEVLRDLWVSSGRCTCDLLNGARGPMPECTCYPEDLPMAQWPVAVLPKPRAGKVMRECQSSDVTHKHEKTGEPCKFVHKNEPEFAMLRPDQLRGAERPPKPAKAAKAKAASPKSSKGGSSRNSRSSNSRNSRNSSWFF